MELLLQVLTALPDHGSPTWAVRLGASNLNPLAALTGAPQQAPRGAVLHPDHDLRWVLKAGDRLYAQVEPRPAGEDPPQGSPERVVLVSVLSD